ncbi:MAG TPA: trypsin-like peptidase domain-containing protein, partial [Ktedonobacterales bacterium]
VSFDVTSVAAHSPVTEQDTAIIKVDAQDMPYLIVAPPTSVSVGDTVTAIAFPADADLALNNADFTALVDLAQSDLNTLNSLLGASVNTGQVTAKKVRSDGTGVYESNGISSQGSSGGPVIDDQGQIIGFVDAGPSTDRLTFLIPSEVIATYTSQAGVSHPSTGAFMTLWTKAANEYDSTGGCHWSLAANDLNTLHTRYPQFGAVQPYLAKAQQQAVGETCAAATGSRSSTSRLLVLVGGILALLVVIGAIVLVIVLLARRKRPARVPVAVPTGAAYPMHQMHQMTPAAGQGAYPGYPGGYGQPATPAMPFQPQQQAYPSQGPIYPAPQQTPVYPGYPSYSAQAASPAPAQSTQQVQQTPPAQPYQQQTPELAPALVPRATTTEAAPGSPAAPTMPMRRCLNGHIVSDPAAIFCPECGAGIQLPHA